MKISAAVFSQFLNSHRHQDRLFVDVHADVLRTLMAGCSSLRGKTNQRGPHPGTYPEKGTLLLRVEPHPGGVGMCHMLKWPDILA